MSHKTETECIKHHNF